jgi:hypothetical protein
MRFAILASVLLAACAPTSSLVPSHPAVARYPATLDATRTAVHDVLAARWLHVDQVGADGFATPPECRTATGDGCPKHDAFTRPADKTSVMMYGFQIAARVVPTDGGVIVRVGAVLEPQQGAGGPAYEIGKGDVPAWVQHEVELVQSEIAHQLAPARPRA